MFDNEKVCLVCNGMAQYVVKIKCSNTNRVMAQYSPKYATGLAYGDRLDESITFFHSFLIVIDLRFEII